MISRTSVYFILLLIQHVAFLVTPFERYRYVPESTPKVYQAGEEVPLFVNRLTSSSTLIPKSYDQLHLPFALPGLATEPGYNSFGQKLGGNKIQQSPFKIRMLEEKILVRDIVGDGPIKYTEQQISDLKSSVKNSYSHHWILDNIPIATRLYDQKLVIYNQGIPIGAFANIAEEEGSPALDYWILYNHFLIQINYEKHGDGYRIVGAFVLPDNVDWPGYWSRMRLKKVEEDLEKMFKFETGGSDEILHRYPKKGLYKVLMFGNSSIEFSYSVVWKEESTVAWSHRWDKYLTDGFSIDPDISNTISCMVVVSTLFLLCIILGTGLVFKKIVKTAASATQEDAEKSVPLLEDPIKSNESEISQAQLLRDVPKIMRLKLVHDKVFLPPSRTSLYCVLVGSGLQLSISLIFILVLIGTGYISQAWRGGLEITTLVSYALAGFPGGFVCSSLLYSMNSLVEDATSGSDWKACTVWIATFYPGLCFGVFFLLNSALHIHPSTDSLLGLDRLLGVFLVWALVMVPAVACGSFMGSRHIIHFPRNIDTNAKIGFTVYEKKCKTCLFVDDVMIRRPILSCFVDGMLMAMKILNKLEMQGIMNCLWLHRPFSILEPYAFPFLCTFNIIFASYSCIILSVLPLLDMKNVKRWWWISFLTNGFSGICCFFYTIFYVNIYINTDNSAGILTHVIFLGYMSLIYCAYFLVLGSLSSVSSLFFVRHLYFCLERGR